MIQITPDIAIDERDFEFQFIRSSGPGGQHVNKVSTAVQLRFNVETCSALSDDVRRRLYTLARNRINSEGILVIDARRLRSQIMNRQDAIDRLTTLIRAASHAPKTRHKTRSTASSRRKRLESKRKRGAIKVMRSKSVSIDE